MEYVELKPHHQLLPFVECYWIARSNKPPFREKESLIPDGTVELMFNFGDDYAEVKGEKKVVVKGSHLIGIRKKSLYISQTDNQNVFSVRFKVGGTYPFFNLPVSLFANSFIGIGDLLGKEYRELEEQLYGSKSHQQLANIMDTFLLKKLDYSGEYLFVEKCSKMLLKNPNLKIRDLAVLINTNYKTIERRFNAVVGLVPAELLKIRRFNNAILSMYSCKHDTLSSIAHECGYYDQSHFIREFRSLSSYSPREFLQEQFTIVQVIQPALADRLSKSYNL